MRLPAVIVWAVLVSSGPCLGMATAQQRGNTKLESRTYRSFVDALLAGNVREVELYKFSMGVDAVVTATDDRQYTVNAPISLQDDELLLQTLKDKQVAYTISDRSHDLGSGVFNGVFVVTMILMWGIPLIGLMVIFIQARTIRRQSETIDRLTRDMSDLSV